MYAPVGNPLEGSTFPIQWAAPDVGAAMAEEKRLTQLAADGGIAHLVQIERSETDLWVNRVDR